MSENEPVQRDDSALEGRYYVRKINDSTGKHANCRYFVLDPQHDPLARDALMHYSRLAVDQGLIGLAVDLRRWVIDIQNESAGGAA